MELMKLRWQNKANMAFLLIFIAVIIAGMFISGCDEALSPMKSEKVAESSSDECFYDIGSAKNYFNKKDLSEAEIDQCLDSGGSLKKNNGYLWGLAHNGTSLWFGTGSNILPITVGKLVETAADMTGYDITKIDFSFNRPSIVGELQKSRYRNGTLGLLGDYRPPRIYLFDIQSKKLTDKTPNDSLIDVTFGIRSAGSVGNVVFLAGPCMDSKMKGINLFAFNATTKAFIGSKNIKDIQSGTGEILAQDINNIRKWITINGILYTTVGTYTGGKVLRWTGTLASPFQFDVVGSLDDQGTELVYHEKRLFVLTWPPSTDFTGVSSNFTSTNVCDIMMTKNEIPNGGLKRGTEFVKAWSVTDYEPDKTTASVYGLGAAASYGGYLYWGTMNVPVVPLISHIINYRDSGLNVRKLAEAAIKTKRGIALFRGKNFASGHPEIDLLYGEEKLEKYENGDWVNVPNNMNAAPLYGPSGFGNDKNEYTWSMGVYQNNLFIGTCDTALPERSDGIISQLNMVINILTGRDPHSTDMDLISLFRSDTRMPGADLWRFYDTNTPAVPETEDCFGNHAVYGFRNMLATDDGFYIGTASSYNMQPDGGWELYKLTPSL